MNNKKAAMFGLDARIALAIFGALSVISGAALYSAIAEAKATATLAEANELLKAAEQYLLDTGSYVGSVSNDDNLKVANLLEDSGVLGWNGPYISGYKKSSTWPELILNKGTVSYGLIRGVESNWATATTADTKCSNTETNPCYVWVYVGIDIAESTLKSLEARIDGTATPGSSDLTGNFRYNVASKYMYMKGFIYDAKQAID
tara:strand:- start:595 stop:1203 length:609 start_codon:yes stop_codon:yes gene_type:complete